MPSSSVRTFSDPDALAAEIRHSIIERTTTQRGAFVATFHRIELHQFWWRHFSKYLSRVAHVHPNAGPIAIIGFRTHPGPALTRGAAVVSSTDVRSARCWRAARGISVSARSRFSESHRRLR